MRAGILVVGYDELVIAHLYTTQHPLFLGNKLGEVLGTQVVGVVGKHLVAWRVLVSEYINLVTFNTNGVEGVLAILSNLNIVWINALEVLDIESVALAGTLQDKYKTFILVYTHLVEEQWVVVAAELQVVLALRCA